MSDHFATLSDLISSPQKREVECRPFLRYARALLFKESVIGYVYVETEYPQHSGRSDYVISGLVKDETGSEYVAAYVWELKAPQCYIFEQETEHRLKPTDDLVLAENQLLHYYEELKGSDDFRAEFNVVHPDHVLMGGIIIGSMQTRVRGEYPEDRRRVLFEKAKRIRSRYFYDRNGIRLLTWDTILEQFRSPTEGVIREGEARPIPTAPLLPRIELPPSE